jgi:hypothetical protein
MLSTASSLFRRVALRGGSPYYYARKWAEIGSSANDFMVRRRMAGEFADAATDDERAVVAEMRKSGFVVLPRPLSLTDELMADSQRRLADHQAKRQKQDGGVDLNRKFFWDTIVGHGGADVDADSIYVRYAAQDSLLRMAALYLGEFPYLSSISLQYSFDAGHAPSHSQLWHRDYDDTKLFKLFIYCTDVDTEEEGAFHVADKTAMKGIYATPLYSTQRYTDDQFYTMVDRRQTHAIKGKAGTTFLCDTRQSFHYGSRCVKPRLACFITYQSYAGLYPAGHVAAAPADAPAPLHALLSRRLKG